MPYLGQAPTKGDENNFKILDNISSYTLTFDGSDTAVVSAANDTITSLSHRFVQGQRVTYNKGGGTVITGLSDGVYYIIKHDHNTIKLATSASNATNGTAVNITNVGGGSSHTLNVAFDGINTKFKATHTNGQKANITRSAQLVISINGVIQQPHDSAAPSTGFGFDLDGTIVFSQAPIVGDVYWAHVLTNNNVTFDISDNHIDRLTGNASTTAFNLSKSPPDNRNVLVTIDGVVQYPNDPDGTVRAYNVVENVLTFTSAPAAGAEIQVRHIGFAGATSGGGGVTNFYGRTGSVVLKNTDNIVANNAEFAGNLTVQGTMTTLDTKVTEVDQLEVAANNTTVGVAITQSGTGDILNLYDGSSSVFSVADGGTVTASGDISIADKIIHTGDTNTAIRFPAADTVTVETAGSERLRIYSDGDAKFSSKLGVGVEPVETFDVRTTGSAIALIGSTNAGGAYLKLDGDSNGDGSGGDYARLVHDTDGRLYIDNLKSTADIVFRNTSSATERFRIDANGNIGINVAPATSGTLYNTVDHFIAIGDNDTGIAQDGDGQLELWTNNEEIANFNTTGITFTKGLTVGNNTRINGSLGINASPTGSGDFGSNSSRFAIGDSDTGLAQISDGNLAFFTNNAEVFRINNTRNFMLRTTTKGHGNADELTIADTDNCGITIRSATNKNGSVFFSDGTSGADQYRGWVQYTHTSDYLTFGTNAVERLRIESGGRVYIGNTQDSSAYGWNLGLQVSGTSTNAGLSIRRDQSGSGGALLMFVKTGGAKNGNTIVSDDDQIGGMYFNAADGTDVNNVAASIAAFVDGTPGSNDTPGRLVFQTTADGANSPTERLRITSAGDVGIGHNAPDASYGTNLNVHSTGGNTGARIKLSDGTSGTGNVDGFDLLGINGRAYVINRENHEMYFSTNNAVRMRINAGGQVNIGNNITQTSKQFYVDGTAEFTSNITCMNQVYINGTAPQVVFTDTNQDSDYTIKNDGGQLLFIDRTNSDTTRMYVSSGGFGGDRLYIANDIVHQGDTDTRIEFDTDTINFDTAGSERLRIDSSGRILIAAGAVATPKASVGGLDVSSGIYSIIMGGETNVGDGTGRRNSYQKEARLGMPHYTNAEEPFGLAYGVTISGENRLNLGGGSSIVNAATSIKFYTAANTTTTGGTSRLEITSSGQVQIPGGSTPLKVTHTGADCVQFHRGSKYLGINADWGGNTGDSVITASTNLVFHTNGSNERFTINSAGNVAIANAHSSIPSKLWIYEGSNDPYVRVQRGSTSNVTMGGFEIASSNGNGNNVLARMIARGAGNSATTGSMIFQVRDQGTNYEVMRLMGSSQGSIKGTRMLVNGNQVCVFGSVLGTSGTQARDGNINTYNTVYEHSSSSYRTNDNGEFGGTFAVGGNADRWYPVWFSLPTNCPPQELWVNKYVHNYATWDGTLNFRASLNGTGYGAYTVQQRVHFYSSSAKNFIGKILYTSHNNAYLVLWMRGGGRSYGWGTIGGNGINVNVGDDDGSHNLGPGNTSETYITSALSINQGYEQAMTTSGMHQQSDGF